ncbi:MAG: NADH:ubiquinone reductase (Na(+)-transporting) subunit C [Bacteroidales bacterium]|nr:NADH:ubiquinone reductase (Na(+)-transporting) subunit C [Bacteroidales bacterium]
MSNSYIFRFATIMVVLVAAILTAVATILKPMQEKNKDEEKMQAILSSANIEVERDEAINKYKERLLAEYMLDLDGNILSIYQGEEEGFSKGSERAFEIDLKKMLEAIKQFEAGSQQVSPHLPMYVIKDQEGDSLFIIPVRGKGLWGPIWGNIALENDLNTIAGASFDHQGETPGLGAEINTDMFSDRFKNTKIFNDQGKFVSVQVIKGGVENSKISSKHGVDAISGGTITSNGVSDMIENVLSYYLPYIKKHQ